MIEQDPIRYASTMFVRFRQQGRRLQASLMQTRRVAGTMRSEHIASLGSVDAEVSVRERLAFWAKLPQRLARLGNRVGPDDQAKVYAALHARIPMVTPDEQRAIQEANAEGDEQFWEAMRDMGTASVEEHKALIARAEAKIAEHTAGGRKQESGLRPPSIALRGSGEARAFPAALASRLTLSARSRQRASPGATSDAGNCWPV